jgi:hypothetical protein
MTRIIYPIMCMLQGIIWFTIYVWDIALLWYIAYLGLYYLISYNSSIGIIDVFISVRRLHLHQACSNKSL